MEQGLVKKETLIAIGNSIRAKNGTETTYTPAEMPGAIEAIKSGAENQQLDVVANGTYNAPEGVGYSPVVVNVPQDGAPTAEELTITGDCNYKFAGNGWDWFIKKYGNQITTKDITNCSNMFRSSGSYNKKIKLPNINGKLGTYSGVDCNSMFSFYEGPDGTLPEVKVQIGNARSMFERASEITEIPEYVYKNIDYSKMDTATSAYSCEQSQMFCAVYKLRKLPYEMLKHGNPNINYSGTFYNFQQCYCLDEIIDLPNPYYNATYTKNIFGGWSPQNFVGKCSRLKDLTFASTMTNGEPNNPKWSNQTIDLTYEVGYGIGANRLGGIEIKDDATYQQFKDDPDAWTQLQEYSRYNHDSAVRTINSLPDTSAFIASNGGTNTIKFKGDSGSKTDGGAISNLTPEEIAVATARGWTVEIV